MKTIHVTSAIAAGLLGLAPGSASAQEPPLEVPDVEVPTVVLDTLGDQAGPIAVDDEADLANIVLSAAKGITTVQEAPAIVTVVTSDEIQDRQFGNIESILDTVPGFYRASPLNGQFPVPLVRGTAQSITFLHDSISLFDPAVNAPTTSRFLPVELIKRVEVITGPGGVLWGSNSLMGIVNVITKDADDVDGVEAGATVGHGDGDRRMAHAYAMAGVPDLFGGKVKLFAHGSFETFQGVENKMPMVVTNLQLPQPTAPSVFGPLVSSEQQQSYLFNLNGKITIGKLQLRVSFPFGERRTPATLGGNPIRATLPNDEACPRDNADFTMCLDPRRTSRDHQINYYDRYAVAEYRSRFAEDRAGLSAKGYLVQFVRNFGPLQFLPPSDFFVRIGSRDVRRGFPGGGAMQVDNISYRAGAAIDGDIEASRKLRVLYGAEAFSEWSADTTSRSRQGDGIEATFISPYDLNATPLPPLCPRKFNPDTGRAEILPGCPLTFNFTGTRTVLAAYVSPQYRPNKRLIFDAGARVQVAPEQLGKLSYPVTTTLAGTVVWNFIPSWHLKVNFAQGFRPPVFNNTLANGLAIQVAGNPDLKVETSDAAQVEVNARIFKGDRRIRELSLRVDGSYTRLQNLITISSGNYVNSGSRGLLSGEMLGKLYVQGGHRLELGYTYLRGESSDRGSLRSLPEHWFNFGAVFNIIDDRVTGTTNLRVAGASEDPNRLVEYRDLMLDERGGILNPRVVASTDMVLDRLPPSADLTLGVTWTPTPRLALRGTVYNALNTHYYQPDVFFDYEPRLEYMPYPYERTRAYVSASYQY